MQSDEHGGGGGDAAGDGLHEGLPHQAEPGDTQAKEDGQRTPQSSGGRRGRGRIRL